VLDPPNADPQRETSNAATPTVATKLRMLSICIIPVQPHRESTVEFSALGCVDVSGLAFAPAALTSSTADEVHSFSAEQDRRSLRPLKFLTTTSSQLMDRDGGDGGSLHASSGARALRAFAAARARTPFRATGSGMVELYGLNTQHGPWRAPSLAWRTGGVRSTGFSALRRPSSSASAAA
jgi:hypothetical protein